MSPHPDRIFIFAIIISVFSHKLIIASGMLFLLLLTLIPRMYSLAVFEKAIFIDAGRKVEHGWILSSTNIRRRSSTTTVQQQSLLKATKKTGQPFFNILFCYH